jgi:hypothetical protein
MIVGGSLFGMLYSYPGSLYFAMSLGLALAGWLGIRWWRGDRAARRNLVRFLVVGCVAAMGYLPLILPAVPQVIEYLPRIRGALGSPWLVVTWTEYATGVMMPPFNEILQWKAANPIVTAAEVPSIWADDWRCLTSLFVPREPLLFVTAFLIVPALIVVGARHIVRRAPTCLPLMAAGLAAPLMAYTYHLWPATPILFYWYLIFALPILIGLVGAGIDRVGERLAAAWRRGHAGWVPAVVFLAVFAFVIHGGVGRLKWWPAAQRAPVAYARGPFLYVTDPRGMTERVPPEDPRRSHSGPSGVGGSKSAPQRRPPPDSPEASMFREP